MRREEQGNVVRLRAGKEGCLSGPAFGAALNALWKESHGRAESQMTLLLLDLDEQSASFRRADYDVERTQREMRDAGLPELLAARLELGL